jgi:transcriptional regulator with XRE-family HTH domain
LINDVKSIMAKIWMEADRQGLTHRQLARKSGVDERTLSLWYTGHCGPGFQNLAYVLDALGLRIELKAVKECD